MSDPFQPPAEAPPPAPRVEAEVLAYVHGTLAPKLVLGGVLGLSSLLTVAVSLIATPETEVHPLMPTVRVVGYSLAAVGSLCALLSGALALACTDQRPGCAHRSLQLDGLAWLFLGLGTGSFWLAFTVLAPSIVARGG